MAPRLGFLKSVTVDPGGLDLVTLFETDLVGNVTAVVDPRGARHTFVYNEAGWLVEDHAPLGLSSRIVYDENGQKVEERLATGENGEAETATRYEYGLLGEVKKIRREIEPGGPELVNTFTYDNNLNVVESRAADGQITRIAYDQRNLPISNTTGADTELARTETFTYTPDGELAERVDAAGKHWLTHYDGYGRVKESVDPLGGRLAATYDDNGNPLTYRVFDAEGTLASFTENQFDALDRLEQSTDYVWERAPGGEPDPATEPPPSSRPLVTSIHYDLASNVTETIDPRSVTSVFDYDHAERLKTERLADGTERTFHYDAAGNNWKIDYRPRWGPTAAPPPRGCWPSSTT